VVAALELLANPNGALLVALQAHSGVLSKHILYHLLKPSQSSDTIYKTSVYVVNHPSVHSKKWRLL